MRQANESRADDVGPGLCESALRSSGRAQPERLPVRRACFISGYKLHRGNVRPCRWLREAEKHHRQERARAGQPEPDRQNDDRCYLDEFHDVRPRRQVPSIERPMRAIEQPVRGSCVRNCKRAARAATDGTLLAVNSDSIARPPIWEATPTHHLDGRRNEPPDTSLHQQQQTVVEASRPASDREAWRGARP
jgi:hypothetical protein